MTLNAMPDDSQLTLAPLDENDHVRAPEVQKSVERTHAGHQTRYELSREAGLSCVLTFTADPDEPATWKILLPGPGGTEDLYGTQRSADA